MSPGLLPGYPCAPWLRAVWKRRGEVFDWDATLRAREWHGAGAGLGVIGTLVRDR